MMVRSNKVEALAPNSTESIEYLILYGRVFLLTFYKFLLLRLHLGQTSSAEVVVFSSLPSEIHQASIQRCTAAHCEF